MLEAKRLAYDANFRNDAKALQSAITAFDALTADKKLAPLAFYYAGWSRWSLAASQFQDQKMADALASLDRATANLRRSNELEPGNPEFISLLAQTMISAASIERSRFAQVGAEISKLRKHALELGPHNPRVIMMDAGLIYWAPPERGGGKEKGITRWLEAIKLLESERESDPLAPDWGNGLAQGWVSNLYLQMTPPQPAEAKQMAERALKLHPEFWWVKTQVLPKL
jgi:tetratricopeptide (TPR) repeat protein